MNEFNIIEYLSGLTGYIFDKSILNRIAAEREVSDVTDYEELDAKTKDLLKADLLYTAYFSPNIMASSTVSHGSFTQTVGSQTLYAREKERLYNMFYYIYEKYEDDKLEEVKSNGASLQWIDF